MTELLRVEHLITSFATDNGVVRAVDGVDFSVDEGRTLGLVGESGSGKSVTALSIMGLIDPPGRIESGSRIVFRGRDLLGLEERELQDLRGNEVSMIFQEPMSSLNPLFSVGHQITESLRAHRGLAARPRGRVRSSCSSSSGSRPPRAGSTSTRTRCRVACASG